jgi:hypothetical protein
MMDPNREIKSTSAADPGDILVGELTISGISCLALVDAGWLISVLSHVDSGCHSIWIFVRRISLDASGSSVKSASCMEMSRAAVGSESIDNEI